MARAARDIDTLMGMTIEQLCAIEDVGIKIAESITEYFSSPVNREIVRRLKDAGLQMSMPEDTAAYEHSDVLGGKAIVISGTFTHHSRDEYKSMIEQYGGRNVSSISKKTDYVLAGENMWSAKLEGGQPEHPIIDEDTFLKMIGK